MDVHCYNILRIIASISKYRLFFGQNQTKQFLELTEEKNVEKVLELILTETCPPNSIKTRFDAKVVYDEDEETISINTSCRLKFNQLPSESFSEPICPIPTISDYPNDEIIFRIADWWLKKSEKSGILLTQPDIAVQV